MLTNGSSLFYWSDRIPTKLRQNVADESKVVEKAQAGEFTAVFIISRPQ
ncbi:hypothetical protein [Dapis sp. BLCC M229]